jgi:hypothetical protein
MKARQRREEEVVSKMTRYNKRKKEALDGYKIMSAILLAASTLLSLVIYVFDGFLQSLAPMTGMILLGSAVGDIVLIAVVAWKLPLGFRLTTVWATLIFLGQVGNALNPGISSANFPQGFPAYLLGMAAVSPSSACPYSCPPFRFSALALLLFQVPLILVASLGWRASKRQSHAREEEETQRDADHPMDAPIMRATVIVVAGPAEGLTSYSESGSNTTSADVAPVIVASSAEVIRSSLGFTTNSLTFESDFLGSG